MTKPLRVALVGFGYSARTIHLPLILARPDLFRVVAVLERSAAEAPLVIPEARVHRDGESLVRDPEWDLGIVTLPNDLHAGLSVAILESGRAVVVEKPLAGSVTDAQAIVDASRRTGQAAFVFHSRRLDGDFQLVLSLVDSGRLGRLVRLECRYDRWANALRKKAWKEQGTPGNTLLEDLGSHLLDQAWLLFGRPARLECRLGVQRDGSHTPDAFRIGLEYPGLWVDLEASMVVKSSPFHWNLQGTGGAFLKGGTDPQEAQLREGLPASDPGFGEEDPSQGGWFHPAEGQPVRLATPRGRYDLFYADVAASLLEGTTSGFPAEDGLRVVRLLDLCRLSAALGRMVEVP